MKKTALRLRTMLHHVHNALRKAPTAPWVMALGLGESKIEEEVLAVKEEYFVGFDRERLSAWRRVKGPGIITTVMRRKYEEQKKGAHQETKNTKAKKQK